MSDEKLENINEETLVNQDGDQVDLKAIDDLVEEKVEQEKESQEETEPSIEEQLETTKDQLLRSMAEVENIRKRAAREKEEMAQYAVTNFARDLLSVADNLNRALESLSKSDQKAIKDLVDGVKITEKELLKVFEKYKINKVDAVDKPFDPNFHQAMLEIPSNDKDPGIVIQEMQIGYTISNRLLRPSMVSVSKEEK